MRLQLRQNEARALAEATAASQSNELRRLQLQLQLAQQATSAGTAHILQMSQSLNVLKELQDRGTLSVENASKKSRMEEELAIKCLAVANAPPDPFAAISAQLSFLSPAQTAPPISSRPVRVAAGGGGVNNLQQNFNAVANE